MSRTRFDPESGDLPILQDLKFLHVFFKTKSLCVHVCVCVCVGVEREGEGEKKKKKYLCYFATCKQRSLCVCVCVEREGEGEKKKKQYLCGCNLLSLGACDFATRLGSVY